MQYTKLNRMVPGLIPVLLAAVAIPAVADDPWVPADEVPIPELNKIKEIKPERVELGNGMVVYFLEDHDFPIVDVRALIRVGSIYEPVEKTGLASMTGKVMRTGGSTKTPGDALDEKLESLGASVEIGIGNTQGTASVSTLAEDLEEGLRVLSEILRMPAFPDDKIDLAKKQERTAIASRNDEHIGILQREMPKLIYGTGHPYSAHTEYATIDAITREDMIAFHKEYFHPNRIIMTVYGDFKKKSVKKLLDDVFGDWVAASAPLPPDPVVKPSQAEDIFLADKKDLTNSVIVIGQEGMRVDDPDYAAMQVFHEAMGAAFTGRLFNEIRTNRGLAYATGSFSGAGLHHPGAQGFYVITQADSTVRTLGYLNDEIARAMSEPLTEEEIKNSKDSLLNSLVFTLSSKGSVLNRMATYEYYGYPQDFLDQYQEAVKKLTGEEILAATKRKIRYPRMFTLIVGEREKFESDLASLGDITEIDITIPEPEGEEIPVGTDADFQKGQELLSTAARATGADALTGLTDMTLEESGVLSIQGMELQISTTTVKRFPDCQRSEQKLPMGTMVQAICGEEAWMDAMRGPQPMPADVLEKFKAEQMRDLVTVLTQFSDMKLQALPGAADVNGRKAHAVYVHSESVDNWKIYLDEETGRIIRMDFRDQSMTGGPVMAQVLLNDYQEKDGFFWPQSQVILHDGEPLVTLTVTSLSVNSGVDDSTFKMP